MSRIGKKPIDLPGGIKVSVGKDNNVLVEGPKGKLSYKVPDCIKVLIEDNRSILLERNSDVSEVRSLHGL